MKNYTDKKFLMTIEKMINAIIKYNIDNYCVYQLLPDGNAILFYRNLKINFYDYFSMIGQNVSEKDKMPTYDDSLAIPTLLVSNINDKSYINQNNFNQGVILDLKETKKAIKEVLEFIKSGETININRATLEMFTLKVFDSHVTKIDSVIEKMINPNILKVLNNTTIKSNSDEFLFDTYFRRLLNDDTINTISITDKSVITEKIINLFKDDSSGYIDLEKFNLPKTRLYTDMLKMSPKVIKAKSIIDKDVNNVMIELENASSITVRVFYKHYIL